MSVDPTERGSVSAAVATPPARATGRRPSLEERRRLVAESLRVGNPGNNARDLPTQADPRQDCQIELAVDEIKPYEHNPRRANNAKFDEIKESIRVCGIRNPITVTRRPGETHFIVEAGGNTRLMATQQLWMETKDPRFQRITVMFRPWRSESHVLIAHLVENEQRGELTFWDKANGVMALKAQLEMEQGCALTLRQLEDELKELGISLSTASLSHFQFSAEKLGLLGESVSTLSGRDVKIIQPRLNLIKRYAEKHAGISEAEIYRAALDKVFGQHAERYAKSQAFDPEALCQDCEQSVAEHFGEPVARLRRTLDELTRSPQMSRESLAAISGEVDAAGSGAHIEGVAPTESTTAPLVNRVNKTQDSGHDQARGVTSMRKPPMAPADGDSGRVSAQSEPQSRESLEAADLIVSLKEQVISFARLTGVADCLHFTGATACGYYMEPPQTPLDLEPDQPLRRWAWWLLALLSGQMRKDVSRRLPDISAWRRLCLCEAEAESALPLLLENELAGPVNLDVLVTDWLTDPADEAATLFCEILTLVRSLRAETPQRHSMPEDADRPALGE